MPKICREFAWTIIFAEFNGVDLTLTSLLHRKYWYINIPRANRSIESESGFRPTGGRRIPVFWNAAAGHQISACQSSADCQFERMIRCSFTILPGGQPNREVANQIWFKKLRFCFQREGLSSRFSRHDALCQIKKYEASRTFPFFLVQSNILFK